MSKLEAELDALANLSPAHLREKWSSLEGTVPPAVPPALLRRLVALRLRERRHGALPAQVGRELARVAAGGSATESSHSRMDLTPGTRLVREWNGQTLAVEVREDGFAHADRTWRSLSEIARHVTGAHWSGPRFFGLTGNG